MARQLFINGAQLVEVKGRAGTNLASKQELGLPEGPISVTISPEFDDVQIDAWGGSVPYDLQSLLAECTVTMNLLNVDRSILDDCIMESFAGAGATGTGIGTIGLLPTAGRLMGGGNARFAANNHFIGLNIRSPIGNKPWRFWYAVLTGNVEQKLGTKRSLFVLTWRVIPYTIDPWNTGLGSQSTVLWDHTLDS